MQTVRGWWAVSVLLAGTAWAGLFEAPKPPYVFTDQPIVLRVAAATNALPYELRTITYAGWGPATAGVMRVHDGEARLMPLAEGIHILTVAGSGEEVRFLALDPPAPVVSSAVRRALPFSGRDLLRGRPYTLLSMGDSVTATGDYEGMLAMLLARATGNQRIRVVDRSYSGRSVDAAARFFEDDAPPNHPSVGLLMYGLNDQAGGVPPMVYLDECRYVAARLKRDCRADCVLLQPTPHIAIPVTPEERTPDSNPPEFAFRTIGFATLLRSLAAGMGLPVAETFQAIWDGGGPTIEDAARRMGSEYPPSYHEQLRSMLETGGKGDSIHPNALGHLAIAKAAFAAMTGTVDDPAPFAFTGVSRWTPRGVVTTLTLENRTDHTRFGRLAVYPLQEAGRPELVGDGQYTLSPGDRGELDVVWPEVTRPEDLLEYPYRECMAGGLPLVAVVDYAEEKARVYGVIAPFEVAVNYERGRLTVTNNTVPLRLVGKHGRAQVDSVWIPAGAEVGRLPVVKAVTQGDAHGWAVAGVSYARYGGALRGEALVDGDLAEWSNQVWLATGEPVQARWVRGPDDKRGSPSECYLRMAFKAGSNGLYVAVRATGVVTQDSFVVFFDPRPAALLGTAGRYYWVSGKLEAGGRLGLGRGETSRSAPGLAGRWCGTPDGAALEFFVPYALMEAQVWPRSGDLGLSFWWTHHGPGGVTQLLWAEEGHPWSPHGYGVVRRIENPKTPLPYRVRVL